MADEVEGDRPPGSPISVFVSHAHEDEKHKDSLVTALAALRVLGRIREWHDRKIVASEEWEGAINESLDTAGIILLLISAHYLESEYSDQHQRT